MNIIARCGCGGITTYVENSMKLLSLPSPDETCVGKEKIRSLASKYPNTSLAEHLGVVAKKSGRYAFYVSTDATQSITAMYNLITGKKVY